MARKLIFLSIAAAVLVQLLAVSANANRRLLPTNPLPGDGNFEVLVSRSGSAERIWCAAGEYALARLRVGATARVYIMNPRGPAQTQANATAVGFTVRPSAELKQAADKLGQSFSVSVTKRGFNLSAGHTRSFCTFSAR